jgi:opacity protein-like surface antigen
MRRLLLLLALVALSQAPLMAQVQAELTYRIGAFVALEDLTAAVDASGNSLTTKQETKFAIGGRLGVWFIPFLGLESTVEYSRSGRTSFLNNLSQSTTTGHLLAASARGVLLLGQRDGGFALVVSGGGGLVDPGDETVDGLRTRTSFGPVAGAGLRINLSPNVTARIDVDGYTYRPEFIDAAGQIISGRRQYDLWITFGLTGPFGDP